MYGVRQLSTLAGVSPRTLHFDDQIGLLSLTMIEENGCRRRNSYSDADQLRIGEEGEAVYRDLVTTLDQDPGSEIVQKIVTRWPQHLRCFYEPTVEVLRLSRLVLIPQRLRAAP